MSLFSIFILTICCVANQAYRHFNIKTGASVTIPCNYDRKYIQHRKYWCYNAKFHYNNCKIQAYANETKGRVTVTDNPAESLFTVTMNNLQTEHTGWYWCAVEIDAAPDVKEYLYITVTPVPDLSVKESRVRGEEGGSVTVQCLYSAEYQNKQKQWCRFKDKYCNTFRGSKTSQNPSVHISDNGRSFSVEMRGLNKSDAGWYWCSAGDLQVPVHISVTDPPPVVTKPVTTHHVSTYSSVSAHVSAAHATAVTVSEETTGRETSKSWYLIFFLLLLVILIIIIFMLRMKCKNYIRTRMRNNDTTLHTVSPNDVDDKIIYSSVVCRRS